VSVTVPDGQTVAVDKTMKLATDPSEPRPRPASPSHVMPAAVIGIGALALVGGSVYSFTVGAPAASEPQPAKLYSGPGIAVAAAGGAAVALGLYLWFHHTPTTSTPTAAITDGGGLVGWAANF
jgi:hypothetical protein